MAKVAAAYNNVDGLNGISKDSPFPVLQTIHVATRNQENKPEWRKILSCRWRKTRFSSGSYSCEAGGTVGAVRERREEGIARAGVWGVDMVVAVVVNGEQNAENNEQNVNASGAFIRHVVVPRQFPPPSKLPHVSAWT